MRECTCQKYVYVRLCTVSLSTVLCDSEALCVHTQVMQRWQKRVRFFAADSKTTQHVRRDANARRRHQEYSHQHQDCTLQCIFADLVHVSVRSDVENANLRGVLTWLCKKACESGCVPIRSDDGLRSWL